LSESKAWYAKVLRNWFSDHITIHGTQYYNTLIRCSDVDVTHFDATAEKVYTDIGPAFRVSGEVVLDPLPEDLIVVDGAQGERYMLHLQAYILSPEGDVIWQQEGFPVGDPWIARSGGVVPFNLIGSFNKNLDGCRCGVLAVGDPILVTGTSSTRVILGMKRFSFQNGSTSSSFDPSHLRPIVRSVQSSGENKRAHASPKKRAQLEYIQSEYNGWKYDRLTSLSIAEKKRIFYDLVLYQDRTGDDKGAYSAIGKRYGLPERATEAIAIEGGLKNWPMP